MLISIVIPSYNHLEYIPDAINSVLNQTHEELELIVVDDGSLDNSVAYLETIKDSRFTHVTQTNHGAHHAINRGLSLCKGEYITILNSDDIYHPNRLHAALEVFKQCPQVDFVSSWLTVIDQSGKELGIKKAWLNMLPWPVSNNDNYISSRLGEYTANALQTNFVSTTSNMIFKKEVYESIGGMRNLRFVHDWDFLLRVCETFTCYNMEQSLLEYRSHPQNTIKENRQWMLFEICWVIAANVDRFSTRLFPDFAVDSVHDFAGEMQGLFNFQKNESVFWFLYYYCTNQKQRGVVAPEEIFLDDDQLREKLLEKIII